MREESNKRIAGSTVVNKAGEELTVKSVNNDDEMTDVTLLLSNGKTYGLLTTYTKGILKYSEEVNQIIEEEIDIENARKEEADRLEEEAKEESEKVSQKRASRTLEEMFDKDYRVEYLKRFPILTYSEVESQFGIKITGFGRGINVTENSIVLISSMEKKGNSYVYHDRWLEGGDYLYSGEGKNGDQTLTKGNKAIADAKDNGKKIFLFVKLSPQEYYYQGLFELVSYEVEDDKDSNGDIRKEYKFRLGKQTKEFNHE